MGTLWAIIVWAVFGLICGAIGRLLVPGRQSMSLLMTMVMGVVGSFIGGFIAYIFAGGEALQASGFLLSIIGAVIAVAAYAGISQRGRTI